MGRFPDVSLTGALQNVAFPTPSDRRDIMAVAKVSEITAGSKKSFEDAVEQGIKRAAKTLSGITGAWVKDQEVIISKGKIDEYRVHMKVTFILK